MYYNITGTITNNNIINTIYRLDIIPAPKP